MRHLFRHTVQVKRPGGSAPGVYQPQLQTVHEQVRGLIEPMSAVNRPSVVGTVPNAKARWTWGTDEIREGDTLVFAGKSYIVAQVLSDTYRGSSPYQTAILTEVKA